MTWETLKTYTVEHNDEKVHIEYFILDKESYGIKIFYLNNFFRYDKKLISDPIKYAKRELKIIDKLGVERAKQREDYFEKLGMFNYKYIMIDNELYEPDSHPPIQSGELSVFLKSIEMGNGDILNGHEYSNEKTLNVLRDGALNHYKMNLYKPKDKHYREEETKEYQKIVKELDEMEKIIR